MKKQQILEKISDLLDSYDIPNTIGKSFEDHNFKVNSNGWRKITVNDKIYLENDTKDIWELLEGYCKGEQLFTWDSAMRETKKAGKTIPSDDDFTRLLKTKDDILNVVFPGHRDTNGSFDGLGAITYLWSSLESGGSAWTRDLGSGYVSVGRGTGGKAYGFSVRCLKD